MIQFKKSTKIYVGNSFNQIYDPKIFEKKSNDFDNVHGELEIQVLKWIKNKTKHEMIVVRNLVNSSNLPNLRHMDIFFSK